MYKIMNKIQTPVLIVAGVLTALLFGITDIAQYLRKDPNANKSSLHSEQKRAIREKLNLQAMLYNKSFSGEDFEKILVDYSSRLDRAQKEGIAVSDKEVFDEIIEQFKDKEHYEQFIGYYSKRGVTKLLFESLLRDQLTFRKSAEFEQVSVYVTNAEIKEEFHRQKDEMAFDFFNVTSDKMQVDAVVPPEAKKKYYDKHFSDAAFQVQEQVLLEALFVETSKIVASTPAGSELRQYYLKKRTDPEYSSMEFPGEAKPFFEVQDKLTASMMQEARKDKAKGVLNFLDYDLLEQDKPDLAGTLARMKKSSHNADLELVKHVKTRALEDSDYLFAEPLGYIGELSTKIFGQHIRNYGGVLESTNGHYLYHVVERLPKHTLSLEESAAIISSGYVKETRQTKARELAAAWLPKLKETADWSKLQAPAEASIRHHASNANVDDQTGLEKARTLKAGEFSDIFPTTLGFGVVRLVERKPADEKGLATEREEIATTLRSKKSQALYLAQMVGR